MKSNAKISNDVKSFLMKYTGKISTLANQRNTSKISTMPMQPKLKSVEYLLKNQSIFDKMIKTLPIQKPDTLVFDGLSI